MVCEVWCVMCDVCGMCCVVFGVWCLYGNLLNMLKLCQ